MPFKRGAEARAAARKGGAATKAARAAARGEVPPYAGDFETFRGAVGMCGPSWRAWDVLWRAVDALPMSEDDRRVFEAQTGRATPPRQPVREAWLVCGRRSGKSRSMAARAAWTAVRRDWRGELARGETATVPLIAGDRQQAATVMGYVRAMFELPDLRPFVRAQTRDSLTLATGAVLRVATCSYRSVRGLTCPAVIADESAFWRTSDGSANPDSEVIGALKPTLMTIRDGLLLVGSTPYSRAGALWRASEAHYGQDSDRVLVWNADSATMNPAVDLGEIAEAFEADPLAAAAEYGQSGRVEFRSDVAGFLDADAVRACVVPDRRELTPAPGNGYTVFVDPSGGSRDSMTLAIAHADGERVVLDVVREARPPFDPDALVAEHAALCKAYGVYAVTGDRYGGTWPASRYAVHGVQYVPSERTASQVYMELLPLVNAARVELLAVPRLVAQLVSLERHTARGGRDTVTHPPNGHDDVSVAAAGACVLALAAGAGGAPCDALPVGVGKASLARELDGLVRWSGGSAGENAEEDGSENCAPGWPA